MKLNRLANRSFLLLIDFFGYSFFFRCECTERALNVNSSYWLYRISINETFHSSQSIIETDLYNYLSVSWVSRLRPAVNFPLSPLLAPPNQRVLNLTLMDVQVVREKEFSYIQHIHFPRERTRGRHIKCPASIMVRSLTTDSLAFINNFYLSMVIDHSRLPHISFFSSLFLYAHSLTRLLMLGRYLYNIYTFSVLCTIFFSWNISNFNIIFY